MTHAEIMKKIKAITEKGIAYANAHADEIENRKSQAVADAETKITQILTNAKKAVKHSWRVYESFKAQISAAASNSEQYEIAITQLTRILSV